MVCLAGRRGSSGLARCAVKRGALRLFDFTNGLAADAAGLAGAAISKILLLKISRTAIRMDKVAQAAATGCNGGKQRFLDDGHEALQARQRNLARGCARVDAGAEQAL